MKPAIADLITRISTAATLNDLDGPIAVANAGRAKDEIALDEYYAIQKAIRMAQRRIDYSLPGAPAKRKQPARPF